MTLEDLQKMCKALPGVKEDIKWGHDLCFTIAEKMFLVTGLDESPVTASFKVRDEEFDELCAREGFKPAPYMARNKWVHVEDINMVGKKEWAERIRTSYDLIKSKLPKKVQESLKKSR